MSSSYSHAFMEGYLMKVAEGDPTALANQYLTPEQSASIGAAGQLQAGQNLQNNSAYNFLGDQQNRDYTTQGVGAAAGGALGYAMGGDAISTLMGTGMGWLVGWLAKHFFGGDINKAYDLAQKEVAKGSINSTIKELAKTNPQSKSDLDGVGGDKSVTDKVTTEHATKDATKTISDSNTTNIDDPIQKAKLIASVDTLKKQDAAKAKMQTQLQPQPPQQPMGAAPDLSNMQLPGGPQQPIPAPMKYPIMPTTPIPSQPLPEQPSLSNLQIPNPNAISQQSTPFSGTDKGKR